MQRGRLPYLLIPIAALIPVLPLVFYGCSCGHDFDFHLLNWLEAARQFSHGNLHPQWAFTPAFNAGEPRFTFYPPLSWILGALLGLIFPWPSTPIIFTWIVLTAAGFSLHHLARSFAGSTAALLAAVFYLVNPYTLFTAYERTAYAELLAAVWIPLLLHAILRERVSIPRIALPVALLWLTNAPAAVMSCYALALLAIVRLILHKPNRLRLAFNTIAGTALGLVLSSIYLVPAAYERRFVHIEMAIIPSLRIQDNFLFHRTVSGITGPSGIAEAALHDTVLHTASVIALLLLAIMTIALFLIRITDSSRDGQAPDRLNSTNILLLLAVLAAVIAFLLTPLSTPIWNHAPELRFLQFPWRILAILAAALALAIALVLRTLSLRPALTAAIALVIAAAFSLPAYHLFRQSCDPEDSVSSRVALFHSNLGTDPTDEYTPITADNDALAHANPPYWFSSNPTALAPANAQSGPAPLHLDLNSPSSQTLILNLRDYPVWRIALNHAIVSTRLPRPDGLIAIAIPAGPSQLSISYVLQPDQIIGALLTVLSLQVLSFMLLRSR